jgi:predicted RND superfamily exporter protein
VPHTAQYWFLSLSLLLFLLLLLLLLFLVCIRNINFPSSSSSFYGDTNQINVQLDNKDIF